MQTAGHQQALDGCDPLGTDLRPTEHPIFPSRRDDAKTALQMIGVDRHIGVRQEHLQARHARFRVLDGVGERVARQHIHSMALVVAPVPEAIDDRLAVLGAVGELLVIAQVPLADDLFVPVQRSDQGQRLCTGLGLGVLRLLKASAAVGLMSSSA